jgi:peptidoglycan/LPS O-acetylase OafA/YrhL
VNAHFSGSFFPSVYERSAGLFGSPLMATMNGGAAVVLFFVLSGFVLPLRYFASGHTDIIVMAAAKRWMRLVMLVLVATLFSYALFRLNLYRYREAGALTSSTWLATFAGSDGQFTPTLFLALAEGALLTFTRNVCHFDVALWTMYHEFLGSFVTLGLAIALHRSGAALAAWFILGATVTVLFTDARLISFIAGTAMAHIATRRRIHASSGVAIASVAIGVYLFGYAGEDRGIYRAMSLVRFSGPYGDNLIFVHTVSAVMVLYAVIGCEDFRHALSGHGFRMLGRLSFPVYVIHAPIIFSLGSYLFIVLLPHASYWIAALAVAGAVTMAVFVAGYGLAAADATWLRFINSIGSGARQPEKVEHSPC